MRSDAPTSLDYEVLHGEIIATPKGRLGLTFARVRLKDGSVKSIKCGAIGMSGGWNPNVHMTCHQRGRPQWNKDLAAFVPGHDLPPGMTVAGAANGDFSTAGALRGWGRQRLLRRST